MSQLVLSLFPGIGLLDMAFEQEGFCVVRGPDLLWGGDIHRFHPPANKFDGVIGGPPCQHWSALAHLVRANGYQVAPDLIPEFVRIVREAEPAWFLMENVPAAPVPVVYGYGVGDRLIRDVWVGGETNRLRRFSFGRRDLSNLAARTFDIEVLALHRPDPELAILASGGHREVPVAIGGSGKRKRTRKTRHTGRHLSGEYFRKAVRLQGLPEGFLDEAPFTVEGKIKAIGNGVPLSMGRAIARAVRHALQPQEQTA